MNKNRANEHFNRIVNEEKSERVTINHTSSHHSNNCQITPATSSLVPLCSCFSLGALETRLVDPLAQWSAGHWQRRRRVKGKGRGEGDGVGRREGCVCCVWGFTWVCNVYVWVCVSLCVCLSVCHLPHCLNALSMSSQGGWKQRVLSSCVLQVGGCPCN